MSRQQQIIEKLTAFMDEKGALPTVIREACEIVIEAFDIPGAVHYTPSILTYGKGWTTLAVCKRCGATGMYDDCHPSDPCSNCGNKEYLGFHVVSGQWVKTKGWFHGEGYWELEQELEA